MKKKRNQRGFTLLELLTAIVIVGILASVAVSRVMEAKNRSHVAAAYTDIDHIRKALAYYSVDYGIFPDASYNSPEALAAVLVDPEGHDYVVRLTGHNFDSFTYSSIDNGNDYEIEVVACDHGGTTLIAGPDGSGVK